LRIVFKFHPDQSLSLPIHYNHLVQAVIYRHLDPKLAEWLHTKGYEYGKRQYKFFTFSRILSPRRHYDPKSKTLRIEGEFSLKVASPDTKFLESLATNLVRRGQIKLNGQICTLLSAEVEMPVEVCGPVLISTLSPIVVYSTVIDGVGKKKTYYYNPWETEFQEKILENLRRKWVAFYGEKDLPPIDGAYIKPVRVNKQNEVIVFFKDTVIKGWTGLYELFLPEPYFTLAYNAGLGAKNSQGFGMVQVVRPSGETFAQ